MSYIFEVARIRCIEKKLLDKAFFEVLINAGSYEEARKLLEEKGYENITEAKTIDELINKENKKTWKLVNELTPDAKDLICFKIEADLNNIKAAIKKDFVKTKEGRYYFENGTVSATLFDQTANSKNYNRLPNYKDTIKEADKILVETRNGQEADVYIDSELLRLFKILKDNTRVPVIKKYLEYRLACADILITYRGILTKKDKEFYERSLGELDSLSKHMLIRSANEGRESLFTYLEKTEYKDAVAELKKSVGNFEKWFDNKIIDLIKDEKYESFSIGPVFAYIIARQMELKTVRIILSGKECALSSDDIKLKMRETYV